MDFISKNFYKNKSDEDLIELINKGNEKAFNEIYRRYSKRLYYFFFKKLYQDHNKAEDFLQDLFLKLIEKANYFDKTKLFSTWFYTIAYNMCKNEYRLNEKQNLVKNGILVKPDVVVYSNVENKYDTAIFNRYLQNELAKIDENHRLAFLMRYQDNLSIKMISEIMGCSEGTVKSRLFYTIKKLSKQLNKFNALKNCNDGK
ncbi:sigma-70 family RNA polymerase sigma factor [Tamlana crocina]|uniref:Sigma-70 family RNA polymerase sigma factor n=1 Tax=Tamlana crocina TaxID=393006 RepID=A0ABX1D6Y5_9FLAO|nr:sigma-70 family RNA polymerase sigma factor [Tamlana crocina]NJX14000.1 sigma-70 family RNA polymerase sigma factor [Tamlana crocina]